VVQTGYYNARAVLDWTIQQQKLGYLAPKLADLAVMGCSAGSMGAQIWSAAVLNELSYDLASIAPGIATYILPVLNNTVLCYYLQIAMPEYSLQARKDL
jgi:hypothetical protein